MLQYTARITSQDTPRVGGRNLLLNSDKSLSNKEYYVGQYDISDPSLMVADEYYTIQIWGAAEGADDSESMWVYNSGGNTEVASIQKSENGVWQMTFKWIDDSKKLNRYLNLFRSANHPNIKKGYSTTIARIKLERGTIATDWAPAPEDVNDRISTVNTSLVSLASTLLDPNQGEIHKLTDLLDKHSENFEDLATHPLTVDDNGYWQIWSVKDRKYLTTQYQSRGEAGHSPVLTLDNQYRLLADGKLVSENSLKGIDRINKNLVYDAQKMTTNRDYKTRIVQLDKTHEFEVGADYIISFYSNRMPSYTNYIYFFNSNHNTQFNAKYLDRDKDGRTYYRLTWRTQYPGQTIVADNTCINIFNADNRGDTPYDFSIWDIKLEQGDTPTAYIPHPKDITPVLSLDEQFRLVADGKLVSAVTLKGRDGEDGAKGADGKDGEKGADGHTPEIHVGTDYYIYVDGVKQRYIRGQKGEPGHNPSPEEVLDTARFAELLGGEVTSKVTPLSKEIDKSSKYAVDLINEAQLQLCDLQVLGMSDGGVIEVKRQVACCHYDYLTPSIGSETNPPQPPKPKYIKQQIPLTLRSSHDELSRQVSNLQTQLTSCSQRLTATKQELAKLKADTTITPILNNTERRKYSSTRKTYGDTLYPQYGDWLLSSDTESLQLSFAGLRAEVGRSIYIQTRKQVYLNANGHTFFGLPGTSSSVAVNQMLANNTTYRFVRADATTWLVTASPSPYPWT